MHGGAHDLIGHAAAGAAQLGQLAKICQKLHQKIGKLNKQTALVSQILIMKLIHLLETKRLKVSLENLRNHIEQTDTISGRL